jgi:hypothetical protein
VLCEAASQTYFEIVWMRPEDEKIDGCVALIHGIPGELF